MRSGAAGIGGGDYLTTPSDWRRCPIGTFERSRALLAVGGVVYATR